jgi:hypothetical protein
MQEEIEIFRFHLIKPTEKIVMTKNEWKNYKKQQGYRYVAYQLDWNKTIL